MNLLTAAAELADALDPSCTGCRTHRVTLLRDKADLRTLLHKRAHDQRGGKDWQALIDRAEAQLAFTIDGSAAHLAEPHAAPKAKARPRRALTAPDTRPECPACGTKVTVRDNRIGSHKAASGNKCPRKMWAVDLDEVPPVAVPPEPVRPATPPRGSGPSRLDVGSECRECGKWLPGERSLCGRCYANRAAS